MLGKKVRTDLVVVCIVSSVAECRGVRDLLRSMDVYLRGTPFIALNNGNGKEVAARLERLGEMYPNLHIVGVTRTYKKRATADEGGRRSSGMGYEGGTLSLWKGMEYAAEHFSFCALLKVDPDSLMVGHGLAEDICAYLKEHPRVGEMGSYRRNCNDEVRDFSPFRDEFQNDALDWSAVVQGVKETHPDYIEGEHIQGGAEIYSYGAVMAMARRCPFSAEQLAQSGIGEDIVFTTLVLYLGFEVAGFVGPGRPLAIAWRGLPLSIPAIRRKRKKLVHSMKFDMVSRCRRIAFACYRWIDSVRGRRP